MVSHQHHQARSTSSLLDGAVVDYPDRTRNLSALIITSCSDMDSRETALLLIAANKKYITIAKRQRQESILPRRAIRWPWLSGADSGESNST